MAKKQNKHPCDGCVWRAYAAEDKVMCMFPRCVREEDRTGKTEEKDKGHGKDD